MKFELSGICRLIGQDAMYGKGMYGKDLTGWTKRQADAWVRNRIALDCYFSDRRSQPMPRENGSENLGTKFRQQSWRRRH